MSLLPVKDALERITHDLSPLEAEDVNLLDAVGRILARDLSANLFHPPFDVSAMDGYAVRAEDVSTVPATLRTIGEAAAGHHFDGTLNTGEAVRIFTGAPLPDGSDTIIIQENTTAEARTVTIKESAPQGNFVKKKGLDFKKNESLLSKGTKLKPRHLSLAAAMNHPHIPVAKKPRVAIIATGDELLPPGASPATEQVISSSPYGVAAMVNSAGGNAIPLGIAKDTLQDVEQMLVRAQDADIVVTIGGASTGDHDLVHQVMTGLGVTFEFWKIAMRPGKPLMYGRKGRTHYIGLPGHPVSAMICARIFLVPALNRLTGTKAADFEERTGILASPLEANGSRQHYMRANMSASKDSLPHITPASNQDSSRQSTLSAADCLILRAPNAPALAPGDKVTILPIDF